MCYTIELISCRLARKETFNTTFFDSICFSKIKVSFATVNRLTKLKLEDYNIQNNLGYLLTTATNGLVTHMQRVITEAGVEVPFEQLRMLMYINKHEGLSQQAICDGLNKVKPGVSRLVDSLVKRDLVEQRPDENDRRIKKLYATKAGKKVCDQFFPVGFGNLKKIEKKLGEKEAEQLKNHLRSVIEIISNSLNK